MSAGNATAVFLAVLVTVLLVPMASAAHAEERGPDGGRESTVTDRFVSRRGDPLSPRLPGPPPEERPAPAAQQTAAREGGGEVVPVLPLGTGLACLGLGLGILGLRLRQD